MTTTYRTTFHRDHTVTIWDCYSQRWLRTAVVSQICVAGSASERGGNGMTICGDGRFPAIQAEANGPA